MVIKVRFFFLSLSPTQFVSLWIYTYVSICTYSCIYVYVVGGYHWRAVKYRRRFHQNSSITFIFQFIFSLYSTRFVSLWIYIYVSICTYSCIYVYVVGGYHWRAVEIVKYRRRFHQNSSITQCYHVYIAIRIARSLSLSFPKYRGLHIIYICYIYEVMSGY